MNKLLYNSKNDRYFYLGYDEGTQSPRKEFEHQSRFITWEGRSASPDKNPYHTFEDILKGHEVPQTGNLMVDLDNLADAMEDKGYVMLPVWKYEHGGACYRAAEGCPFPDYGFDSGLVGVIYEEVLPHEDPEHIKEMLKAEVYEEYTAWIEGNIFYVSEYSKDGELLDSIGGIYNQDFDDEIFVDALNDYFNAEISSMDALEEVGYEYDFVYDEELDEDIRVEMSIEDRIQMHQDDMEYNEPSHDEEER